jgi:hypothetical protein
MYLSRVIADCVIIDIAQGKYVVPRTQGIKLHFAVLKNGESRW